MGGGREIEWKVRDILSNQSLRLQHSQGFWRLNMNYMRSCHKYWKMFVSGSLVIVLLVVSWCNYSSVNTENPFIKKWHCILGRKACIPVAMS